MKLITVFIIVTFATIQISGRAIQDLADKFAPEEACVNEVQIDRNEVIKQTYDLATPEDDVLYGKFFACVWRKRGVMDEEGNINSKEFRHFLEILSDNPIDLARINYVVKKCSKMIGNNPGQTGIKLKNCMAQVVSESS